MEVELKHETLVFERSFAVPPARVFEAYADPRQREAWSAPEAGMTFEIVEADVRTGGRETARTGTPGAMEYTAQVVYHFVEPDTRLVLTEELWMGDVLLTIALITFDIAPSDPGEGEGGSRLTLTDQITSLVGDEGVDGHRDGYGTILAQLEAHLRPVS